MKEKITVSGNIISELSEKIPSNIIALHELIKNSYDAGAKTVFVTFDSKSKRLIIEDDGSGMDQNDIRILLHISKSTKKYGEINKYGRYTQGSKGLGFLSVFKFGNYVEWTTKKDKGLKFSINYNELVDYYNVSDYKVELEELDIPNIGTRILIELTDYNVESLKELFKEEKNYLKIINAFEDSSFEVKLDIDGQIFTNKNEPTLLSIVPEDQLFYIKYNSNEQIIKYIFNGYQVLSKDYKFTSDKYELELELLTFHLLPYGKSKIYPLYINPQGDLAPLVYINSNLFNNYDLFDSNIMKNIKSGSSLNQMIGSVRVKSNNTLISFNSDRSQFLQNELTDEIKEFLKNINITIQDFGSKHKKHLKDFDILECLEISSSDASKGDKYLRSLVKKEFAFTNQLNINKKNNIIIYSLFGKSALLKIVDENKQQSQDSDVQQPCNKNCSTDNENPNNTTVAAQIKLKQSKKTMLIPSKQINLYEEIESVNNSKGESISYSDIEIKCDGEILPGGILYSIDKPCTKNILYSYFDTTTKLVSALLTLNFIQQYSPITTGKKENKLISIPASDSYQISYNFYVEKLIEQINSLEIDNYMEMMACSLRAIFELSIDSVKKSSKFNNFKLGSDLTENVEKIIKYINTNNKFITEIDNQTKIGYQSLKNLLDIADFNIYIPKLHLGAHKSSEYTTKAEITKLCKLTGVFVVIINEMINNQKIY